MLKSNKKRWISFKVSHEIRKIMNWMLSRGLNQSLLKPDFRQKILQKGSVSSISREVTKIFCQFQRLVKGGRVDQEILVSLIYVSSLRKLEL